MFLLLFLLRSVRSTRAPVLDLLASVLQAAKPLIHFGSAQAPAPIKRVSRREILIKVALRVARSQIKALFRPFYESCISEPPNSFFGYKVAGVAEASR